MIWCEDSNLYKIVMQEKNLEKTPHRTRSKDWPGGRILGMEYHLLKYRDQLTEESKFKHRSGDKPQGLVIALDMQVPGSKPLAEVYYKADRLHRLAGPCKTFLTYDKETEGWIEDITEYYIDGKEVDEYEFEYKVRLFKLLREEDI